jgi:hypothetical protein
MKHLLPAFFLLAISIHADSQGSQLPTILRKIIKDSSNLFSTYKGEFESIDKKETGIDSTYDSTYNSTIIIPGTFDNAIVYSPESASYFATIAVEISQKKALSLLKKWKDELEAIFSVGYVMREYSTRYLEPAPNKHYSFKRGNLSVTIYYNTWLGARDKDKSCAVNLHIFYFAME